MKKTTCFFLVLVLITGLFALPAAANKEYSHTIENCYNFIDSDNGRFATSDVYYSYDNFVNQLDSSDGFAFLELALDCTSELTCAPDVDDYIESLSNVIALQDIQNASDLSTQQALDNLKDSSDYCADFRELCIDGLSLAVDVHGSELAQKITDLTTTVLDKTELTAEYIQNLNNLYNQISDYAAYDFYLSQIEANSDGELKEAAQIMRDNMSALLEYTLDDAIYTFSDAADVKLWNVDESLFSNIDGLIDSLAEHTDGPVMDVIQSLKDAYKLGTDGALLAGDFFLGTENVAKRVCELRTLLDISNATLDSIEDLQYEFLLAYEGGYATEEMVNRFTEMLDHLYDTRRRGEYCLYSTIMEDSGLLSFFFGTEDVEEWYKKIVSFINDKEWYLNMIPAGPEALATHHYYVFDGVASSWEEAEAYCESLGGHLAVIGSQYENDLVYSIVQSAGYKSAYFGLTDSGSEGSWRTVNGEPLIYSNWGGREPNNERGKEHYAMFYYKSPDGAWNDGDFGHGTLGGGTAFVCEWEVDPESVDINTLLPKN